MVNLELALVKDAKNLLEVQKECFKVYKEKYGDFDSNPYDMTLHRMEFNLKYRFGHYYKVVDFVSGEIVGGIFFFELDDPHVMKIDQFYLLDKYRHQGTGTEILNSVLTKFSDVKCWYVDTIMEEDYNVNFYKKIGFKVLEVEEYHAGLNFMTLIYKK